MADDEQFSLCWNNFNTNLSAGFHESLIQGDLVDVTLAAEGQLVKAHRLILSVCSPYFRKMFTQMPANQHAFIFLKDVSHSALKDLIQFMYCGEVNVKQDALPAFISTAEALQIKGLTETGESAPAQQSPAKDTSHHLPSSGVTTIPSSASSPRAKPVQRSRIQSYKIDSDNESEHEKVVQIQATSTSTNASSSSTGPSATIVATQVSTAPQQVQIIQQQQQAQKRTLQQRASITPQTTQIMKRAKLSDPLEAPEPAQIQTVQIVKQITQTPQPTISSEPEYVEMPIETINPKAEPDYVDDPSEVEAIETEHEHEHEHEQALTEHEAAEHEQDADDNYVEDETYGEMAKYDESYFTEGEEVKAGASGFGSESYTDCGTAADQAAQENDEKLLDLELAQFGSTQRGRPLLVYKGYRYIRNGEFCGTINWRCSAYRNKKCKAKAITVKHNGEEYVKLSYPVHSHTPKESCHGEGHSRKKVLARSSILRCEEAEDDDTCFG
ncbi:modifier of mdg4-like isoform X18 [Toxorhynchites rutilus septentrionalis]|uniref:modifier of mdg4-like isoform X18 n=1 Tax=Toxorhynchites rutilus septentrionalis TaxID=329112 RepID=UPI0024796DD6|nr:modifier of mdg4-like isoform X18 [Toxorhynchites rutilus septentrionalis]